MDADVRRNLLVSGVGSDGKFLDRRCLLVQVWLDGMNRDGAMWTIELGAGSLNLKEEGGLSSEDSLLGRG